MPSLSTLVDNFNDNAIAPNWGNSYGGVTETGGRARVPCTASYAGYQTAYSWTLAGATFYVAVLTVPAASTATEAYASVFVNAPDVATSGVRIGFVINTVTGLLQFNSETAYFDAGAVSVTYSAATHKFLRMREDGTNVYWDTSPDGSTWTNRRTLATPAWVTASIDTCALDLSAHRDAGTNDVAEYDQFNTLSNGAVFTGTATGSAQSTATAAGTRTADGTATGSAQTNATAAGVAIYRGTAAGSAQAHATVTSASDEIPEVAEMAAGDLDLYIEQGATFVQTYTVTAPDFSWDGWSARAQIRTSTSDAAALLVDLTPFLEIDGAAIRLAIPASTTQTLTRNGRWDLEVAMGSTVVRILQGRAIISPEVTRA